MVSSKIRQLRTGTPIHKKITLGSGDSSVDLAVVILNADVSQEIEESVQEYASENIDKVNDAVKNQYYNVLLAYHCLRDPDDLSQRVVESPKELQEILDLEDISRIVNAYGELMMNKAPKLELLSQDQIDVIKKHLEVTPLKDLSTVLLVHLVSCHQTIVSEI